MSNTMENKSSYEIKEKRRSDFRMGIKQSIPIAVGYFSVSFTFGIMAAKAGLSPLIAGIISLTNVTSAGQFAGLSIIASGASMVEMFLTQLIINLRYALMSLSLSQKIPQNMSTLKRMLIAFANTDEIFAVSITYTGEITPMYMAGLESLPVLCWTAGTVVGAVATDLLPHPIQSALGVALYGMFIAIVIPPAKKNKGITIVALIAMAMSCMIKYIPALGFISSGFSIIICTLLAAGLGAFLFPIPDKAISENNSDASADDNADKIEVKTVDKAENKTVENQVQTETIPEEEKCGNGEVKP